MADTWRQPLTTGRNQDAMSPEEFPSTYWEGMGAQLEQSALATPMNELLEMGVKNYHEGDLGSEKLPPAELNQIFPGTTFTSPQTKATAAFIHESNKYKAELQRKIEAGPDNMFYGISKWIGGLVPQALDPINYLSGRAIGAVGAKVLVGTKIGGALGYTKRAELATEAATAEAVSARAAAAKALTLEQFTIGGVRRNVAEGLVGGAVVEPINAAYAQSMGQEYSALDAATNIGVSAVGFTALHQVIGRGARFLGKLSGKHMEIIDKLAEARVATDKLPAPDVVIQDIIRETGGSPKGTGNAIRPETFRAVDPTNFADRDWHGVSHTTNEPISVSSSRVVGAEGYGAGVYLSDSPHVANGEAARKIDDASGDIHVVNMPPDTKLLNLDQTTPVELVNVLNEQMPKAIEGTEKISQIYEKVKAMMEDDKLPPESLDNLNKIVKDLGYDGIHYMEDNVLGIPHDPHNVAMLFDESRLTTKEIMQSNPEVVPRASSKELSALREEMNAPEQHPLYNKEADRRLEEAASAEEIKRQEELTKVEQRAQDLQKEIAELSRLEGIISKEDIQELKDITEKAKDSKVVFEVLEAAKFCMGRHG